MVADADHRPFRTGSGAREDRSARLPAPTTTSPTFGSASCSPACGPHCDTPYAGSGTSVLHFGNAIVDLEKRQASREGAEVRLTPIEFRLLAALAKHLGLVATHRQLLTRSMGADARERHALLAHLHEAVARKARARPGPAAPPRDGNRRGLSTARGRLTSTAGRAASTLSCRSVHGHHRRKRYITSAGGSR